MSSPTSAARAPKPLICSPPSARAFPEAGGAASRADAAFRPHPHSSARCASARCSPGLKHEIEVVAAETGEPADALPEAEIRSGKIPARSITSKTALRLYDSRVILEYLDHRFLWCFEMPRVGKRGSQEAPCLQAPGWHHGREHPADATSSAGGRRTGASRAGSSTRRARSSAALWRRRWRRRRRRCLFDDRRGHHHRYLSTRSAISTSVSMGDGEQIIAARAVAR